jgi:signal transduction histidine kinase
MSKAKLIISGPSDSREVVLDPEGMVLGRELKCDIVLCDKEVSRRHAKVSRDTFGRWVIEDLGSQNGILIEGQPVKAQAIRPYETIEILPFSLHLELESDHPGTGEFDRAEVTMLSYGEDKTSTLSPIMLQRLNGLHNVLKQCSGLTQLYPEACNALASMLHTLVAIVRLPNADYPMPQRPEVLACHTGVAVADPATLSTNIHLSQRVLSAVRATDTPVMARSANASDEPADFNLTVVDTIKPHIVMAIRVNDTGETVDTLYVDMLEEKSPHAMLDFIELVARQISFVQKNLYLAELTQKEQALRRANDELRQKDRIKDEYVSRITHDIKGHLAAIANCLYVASDMVPESADKSLKDFVDRAQNRTGRLTEFVKNLLELTRRRLAGTIDMANFSLTDSLNKAVADVTTKAVSKAITLNCDIDPAVGDIRGNELSIHEVLANLVSNAVKYTPDNGQVDIRARSLGHEIQVEVTDTGIGIPQQDLEHVFDEFFRAGNAVTGKEEGTGLGLSIVKQIVDTHGGHVSVTSQEGQGTTFTLALPMQC